MKNYHYILANLVSPSADCKSLEYSSQEAGLTYFVCVCRSQGFMDLNMTEFQKLGPNVTGFELVNRSDPALEKVNRDWLDFDSKDLKVARRTLRVCPQCSAPPV